MENPDFEGLEKDAAEVYPAPAVDESDEEKDDVAEGLKGAGLLSAVHCVEPIHSMNFRMNSEKYLS